MHVVFHARAEVSCATYYLPAMRRGRVLHYKQYHGTIRKRTPAGAKSNLETVPQPSAITTKVHNTPAQQFRLLHSLATACAWIGCADEVSSVVVLRGTKAHEFQNC